MLGDQVADDRDFLRVRRVRFDNEIVDPRGHFVAVLLRQQHGEGRCSITRRTPLAGVSLSVSTMPASCRSGSAAVAAAARMMSSRSPGVMTSVPRVKWLTAVGAPIAPMTTLSTRLLPPL